MERQSKSKYYLFIDECGDHNLDKYDPSFPIFTLCGILVSRKNLNALNKAFENLKTEIFGAADIVIHSVEIRKWRGAFLCLKDETLRIKFLKASNASLANTTLTL